MRREIIIPLSRHMGGGTGSLHDTESLQFFLSTSYTRMDKFVPDNGTNTYTPGRGGLRGEIILFPPQFLNFYILEKAAKIVQMFQI